MIELTDGTILLRQYREEDIDALYEAARESVTETSPWLPWCHPEYTRGESEAWIRSRPEAWEKETEYTFAVFDSSSGKFLGSCGIHSITRTHQFGAIGYWVRTSATGKGVATRATRLTARFGFEELGLCRIEILVATGNDASMRIAEKVGAHKEGLLRKRIMIRDKMFDATLYALFQEDL